MKKIYFILINLITCLPLASQGDPMNIIYSPQVADISRYDNTPVALNSGRLDLNIPLLEVKDNNFDCSVTACYNSTGFIPTKPESCIGLNWSLKCGGVIYREVRGIADDIDELSGIKGFLHLIKEKKVYDPQAVASSPSQYINFVTGCFKDSQIEANPDLYHFQFGNYSGAFSMGYDGKNLVSSKNGEQLNVDLSNYEYFSSYNQSIIKITTEDGYQYCFGGSKDNIEYSIRYINNLGGTSPIVYSSAFFLYKIISPNGRTLDIKYKKIPSFYNEAPTRIMDESSYTKDLKDCTTNFTFTGYNNISTTVGHVEYNTANHSFESSYKSGYQMEYILTKTALIDEVISGDQKMKFYYSPRKNGQERFKNVAFTLSSRCGALLDSITLSYQNKVVKNVRFEYKYLGGSYPAFFMANLIMPDNGRYEFSYKSVDQLPNPMSANLDYWNFWKGNNFINYSIPDITIYNNYDYKYNSDIREPNPDFCDVSLLSEISYPTGGKAQITYEPHSYSKKVDKTSSTSFKPGITNLSSDVIGGGARVKSISYSDKLQNIKTIGYEYTNSKTDKRSSGILMYYPKYFEIFEYVIVYTDSGVSLIPISPPSIQYCNIGLNLPSYDQDHVRYSTVREINSEGMKGGTAVFSSPVAEASTSLEKLASLTIENNIGYWDIIGLKPGGNVTIYVKQNDITKKIFVLKDDNSIQYIPDLNNGVYDIYYQKTSLYGFYIRVHTPSIYEGAYKELKFSDYITSPDNFLDDKTYCEVNGFTPTDYEKYNDRLSQDRSIERGLILSENTYNTNGILINSINNNYTISPLKYDHYSFSLHNYNGFIFGKH